MSASSPRPLDPPPTVRRRRYSLLGHPVRHSVSPAMCTAGFAALGMPHVYTSTDVPNAAGLARIVEELRSGTLAGCNVTVPYKRAVLDLADVRAESAEEVGAANVLTLDPARRIIAHNTDAEALFRDLDSLRGGLRPSSPAGSPLPPPPRLRAAVIGSGGAALAALIACRRLGFKVICMTSRSWVNTETMFDAPSALRARSFGALTAPWPNPAESAPTGKLSQALRLQWSELVAHADCVIQATSAGMRGGDPGEDVSSVVAWDRLPPHAIAYDVVYNPRVTPFLRAAKARGLVAVDGLGMLVRQAALSIALWTGRTPPLDRLRAAAEEALDAGWTR
jgi:shikimate dehydrogenase